MVGLAVVAGATMFIGQLVLPTLAARVVRDRLGSVGVLVSVRAMPAVELLWGRADAIEAHVATYTANLATLSKRLGEMRRATDLNITIRLLRAGRLELRDVVLRKRGTVLLGSAAIELPDLDRALPRGVRVAGVNGSGVLELETVDWSHQRLLVLVREGQVLVQRAGPLGPLLARDVFADPNLRVLTLAFRRRASNDVLTLRATARLR